MKSHRSPPLLSGQSVGGALTSAKSAMSSWFSTLAQPPAVTTPEYPEPATEVLPWNQTHQCYVSDSVLCPLTLWLLWSLKVSGLRAAFMKERNGSSLNHPHVWWLRGGATPLRTGRQRFRYNNCTVHIHCEAETAKRFWSKTQNFSAGCIMSDRLFVLLDAFFLWDTTDAVVGFAVFTLLLHISRSLSIYSRLFCWQRT